MSKEQHLHFPSGSQVMMEEELMKLLEKAIELSREIERSYSEPTVTFPCGSYIVTMNRTYKQIGGYE